MSQLDIFNQSAKKNDTAAVTVISNGEYVLFPHFFSRGEADSLFHSLLSNTKWKQESMNMYGKRVDFPRLTAWYGDDDRAYSFSGITLNPNPWTDDLLVIKNKIEHLAGTTFNSVLLNLYRNGQDSISWHTDAEEELGKNPVIGSVSLGTSRIFQLRHIVSKEKIQMELTHGSMLVMRGETQHFWQHQIPKTSHKIKERINLTFRTIK